MDKVQNSLIANIEKDKLDIASGGFKPPIEDPKIDGALWNDAGVLKISGAIPTEPGVRIRYTSTDDLTTLDAFAIGGTAYITDNGDGTYDLWSDDACEFIALSDDYYNYKSLNITKIEVIEGNSLKYFYYVNGEEMSSTTFGYISNVVEFINNSNLEPVSTETMFSECKTLINIDLGNFNTSDVTNMRNMFSTCELLTSINISNFDTANVTDMAGLFVLCSSLESINVNNIDTASVTDMRYMFSSCESLLALDISNFDMSNVINTRNMFADCTSLECLTNLDTTTSTDKQDMFESCKALIQPDATAQEDLMDVDGADWVNPGSCP